MFETFVCKWKLQAGQSILIMKDALDLQHNFTHIFLQSWFIPEQWIPLLYLTATDWFCTIYSLTHEIYTGTYILVEILPSLINNIRVYLKMWEI